jgi:hypothetical protein
MTLTGPAVPGPVPAMAEITVWSLPKALLTALPETAPVLAALAADAFDLDDDDLAEVADEVAAEPDGGAGSRLDRINALLGLNLHAEYDAFRILGAAADKVLIKAIDTGNDELAGRCAEFLEAVLDSADGHLHDAVALLLESAQWTGERWTGLRGIAGPHLSQRMDQREGPAL